MCTRSAHAAVSKVSADAVPKKVLNVRRKKAGEFLKDVRAINAIKLEEPSRRVKYTILLVQSLSSGFLQSHKAAWCHTSRPQW